LELWVGTEAKAIEAAQLDDRQYQLDKITSHTGDPLKRSTMTFCVHFADGDIETHKEYSQDLADSQQLENYCRSRLRWELLPLLQKANTFITMIAQWHTHLELDDEVYVKLRGVHGMQHWNWYASLDLPDLETKTYYVKATFTRFAGSKYNLQNAMCFDYPVLKLKLTYYLDWIYLWARAFSVPEGCVLVDEAFVEAHPQVLSRPSSRAPQVPKPLKVLAPTTVRLDSRKASTDEPPTSSTSRQRKVTFAPTTVPVVTPRARALAPVDPSILLDQWGYPISRKQALKAQASAGETPSP
jgi:hypothetical protein